MTNRKRKRKFQIQVTKNTNSSTKTNLKEESNINDILEDRNNNKIVVVLSIIVLICISLNAFMIYMYNNHPKIKIKEEYKVPENIVFLGDSITNRYDLDKFYPNNNVVNSGIGGNQTKDILDNMKERVYRYNPSKVILLIGTNDTAREVENNVIIDNISKIISNIKKERPQAKIYVESIYPITDDAIKGYRTNDNIMEINEKIKEICDKEKIDYINLYDMLSNEEGKLNSDYTVDGLHISEEGYKIITKELEKYINE